MAELTFADSHNMVAYLEKSKDNADFAKIFDFLNASPIRYALTISPTVYVSYIKQFWSTAMIKTVNNETQIRAKVDGKTIVITESSMRRDLHSDDEDEVNAVYDTPSHTKKIFANMRRQGKDFSRTVTSLFSSMLAHQADMDEAVHEERGDSVERAATTATNLDAESGGRPRRQETMGDRPTQTRIESLSKQSYDSPLRGVNTPRSDEDRIELKELMEICTKFSERVLDLETTKTAQAKEIANLKKIVKKLERKRKSRTLGMNLFKIDSNFDEEFDANMDEAIEQVYDANKDTVEEGEVQVPTADMKVNTASAPVTTAGVSISTAEPITTAEPSTPPTTTTTTTTVIEDEDLTIV
ncbi:hypothetical protein Tco_1421720 [Tanacetum coccineum]